MRRLVFVVALVGLVAAACSGSGGSAASKAKYCDVARKLSADVAVGATTDYKTAFQQFDSFADQFLAAVPAAIKTDATTLITGIRKLETSLRSVNFDPAKVDVATVQQLTTPAFTDASKRVADYNKTTCGITTATTPTT